MSDVIYFFRVQGYSFNHDLVANSGTIVINTPIQSADEFDTVRYALADKCGLAPDTVEIHALNRL